MPKTVEFTLTEIATLLGSPQFRLIDWCESGVVAPDIEDARGRGRSRRFSRRNVLEFAIALRLRTMRLQGAVAPIVIQALRAFDEALRDEIRGFDPPDSLRTPDAPKVTVILSDGERLDVCVTRGNGPPRILGGIELPKRGATPAPKGRSMLARARAAVSRSRSVAGPQGARYGKIEISITRIAQDLPLGDA